MSSLAKARPSDEDRGKRGRRTWCELRITDEKIMIQCKGL